MVNTLELRGIETYSPEIQTFLREIEKSFLQVLNNCVPADQQEKEAIQLRDTVEGIGNCLEMHCAPGEVFECFSCGAFKEAAAILESTYGEMLKSIKNLKFVHDDQNVITLPRDIIRDYIDGEKFINEIPCDSEGRELATLNQNASKANDNW